MKVNRKILNECITNALMRILKESDDNREEIFANKVIYNPELRDEAFEKVQNNEAYFVDMKFNEISIEEVKRLCDSADRRAEQEQEINNPQPTSQPSNNTWSPFERKPKGKGSLNGKPKEKRVLVPFTEENVMKAFNNIYEKFKKFFIDYHDKENGKLYSNFILNKLKTDAEKMSWITNALDSKFNDKKANWSPRITKILRMFFTLIKNNISLSGNIPNEGDLNRMWAQAIYKLNKH